MTFFKFYIFVAVVIFLLTILPRGKTGNLCEKNIAKVKQKFNSAFDYMKDVLIQKVQSTLEMVHEDIQGVIENKLGPTPEDREMSLVRQAVELVLNDVEEKDLTSKLCLHSWNYCFDDPELQSKNINKIISDILKKYTLDISKVQILNTLITDLESKLVVPTLIRSFKLDLEEKLLFDKLKNTPMLRCPSAFEDHYFISLLFENEVPLLFLFVGKTGVDSIIELNLHAYIEVDLISRKLRTQSFSY